MPSMLCGYLLREKSLVDFLAEFVYPQIHIFDMILSQTFDLVQLTQYLEKLYTSSKYNLREPSEIIFFSLRKTV